MSLYFETSYASLNKFGEELCGDKAEVVKEVGETTLVLSDGLGSGVKANILASLTSKIVTTMLAAGAEVEDVVETLASTLPICNERKIAYSTFTFLHIDSNGNARLVEYDNPDMVILRRGRPLELEKTRRTIAGKEIREAHVVLRPDDTCVLFSDGAVHAGVGKLLNFGWQHKNIVEYLERSYNGDASAHTVARQLLSACDDLYMHQPGDDTTVMVCRVCRPRVAHIMVGPPIHPEDDAVVVKKLMDTDGKKVVCGGTTSQIVSRILGKALTVSLNYVCPEVPPMGAIQGVDLVTEGVVTLGRTLEYIRRYIQERASGDTNTFGKDGAAQLARLLIEDCTSATFYVGRALNSAHQNPGLPIDLSLKLRLVEDIAAALRSLDKVVTVEYY